MKTHHIRLILGAVAVLGFFATVFALLTATLHPTVETVLKMLAGAEVTILVMVYQFFFGSSEGSKDKTALLAKANGHTEK